MAGITLEVAQARLELWLAAEEAVAVAGQSYSIDTGGTRRTLTRADLPEIRKSIDYWQKQVSRLSRGVPGPSVRYVVPGE